MRPKIGDRCTACEEGQFITASDTSHAWCSNCGTTMSVAPDVPVVMGGQGRAPEELVAGALALIWALVGAVIAAGVCYFLFGGS